MPTQPGKIQVIKDMRSMFPGLGLKDAKDIVDGFYDKAIKLVAEREAVEAERKANVDRIEAVRRLLDNYDDELSWQTNGPAEAVRRMREALDASPATDGRVLVPDDWDDSDDYGPCQCPDCSRPY